MYQRSIHTQHGVSRLLVGGIALGAALCSFALTPVLWPTPDGLSGPPAGLMPGFIVLSIVESLVFGVGVAFAVTALPLLRRGTASPALTWATYLAVTWLLVSWWPHDNFHRVLAHNDWAGLLRIEYGFHVTLIAAALVVARYVLHLVRPIDAERQPS